ncbi:MAG TPA: YaeQ family protein [Stenotrophobium sp.]|jgi:uncharacterized protein YaeQ|nr:YaeQ family protein [Stenotrophobium sp.]
MALTATIYSLSVQLSDMDRSVYQTLDLRVARHPSETAEYMLTRVLAYCLEFQDGIAFTEGVSAVDEPAVVVRDLTGRITSWIEVGAPDSERLHRGSKLAGHAVVYTHRSAQQVLAQLDGRKIHRAADIAVHALERPFIDAAASALQRRTSLALTVTERQLYLDIDGKTFNTRIETHAIA